jgi:hypothetical protein
MMKGSRFFVEPGREVNSLLISTMLDYRVTLLKLKNSTAASGSVALVDCSVASLLVEPSWAVRDL